MDGQANGLNGSGGLETSERFYVISYKAAVLRVSLMVALIIFRWLQATCSTVYTRNTDSPNPNRDGIRKILDLIFVTSCFRGAK